MDFFPVVLHHTILLFLLLQNETAVHSIEQCAINWSHMPVLSHAYLRHLKPTQCPDYCCYSSQKHLHCCNDETQKYRLEKKSLNSDIFNLSVFVVTMMGLAVFFFFQMFLCIRACRRALLRRGKRRPNSGPRPPRPRVSNDTLDSDAAAGDEEAAAGDSRRQPVSLISSSHLLNCRLPPLAVLRPPPYASSPPEYSSRRPSLHGAPVPTNMTGHHSLLLISHLLAQQTARNGENPDSEDPTGQTPAISAERLRDSLRELARDNPGLIPSVEDVESFSRRVQDLIRTQSSEGGGTSNHPDTTHSNTESGFSSDNGAQCQTSESTNEGQHNEGFVQDEETDDSRNSTDQDASAEDNRSTEAVVTMPEEETSANMDSSDITDTSVSIEGEGHDTDMTRCIEDSPREPSARTLSQLELDSIQHSTNRASGTDPSQRIAQSLESDLSSERGESNATLAENIQVPLSLEGLLTQRRFSRPPAYEEVELGIQNANRDDQVDDVADSLPAEDRNGLVLDEVFQCPPPPLYQE